VAASLNGSKKVEKVVLAYSGGLDTSVILKWLQETYDCEVVTFTADLGQVCLRRRWRLSDPVAYFGLFGWAALGFNVAPMAVLKVCSPSQIHLGPMDCV
jgi:Arginosuccinate synthase